ncbi:MAG: PilZ domain-containing protein [Phycisphaeraceae bacterium]|nr:PilZ domain-containing protein [Phycisphaeraceae bacterium]MBX3365923.1 PilZ domain-containing protein [Phycisphaeraceae bacterium]MCW5768575.1 PilZ domain-containing protein [Phycisphaeraceae bacterium]
MPASTPDNPGKHTVWRGPEQSHKNHRRHGRVKCHDIYCTLGEVLDLSASGLRIRTTGKLSVRKGDAFSMTIETLDGPMLAPVRITWIRRVGFRRHEIGVAFVETGEALARALGTLARAAANNEVITPWYRRSGAA